MCMFMNEREREISVLHTTKMCTLITLYIVHECFEMTMSLLNIRMSYVYASWMLLRTPLHPHRCASRCLAPAWWNHRHAWWPWGSWFAKHQLWVTWQLGRYWVFQLLPYTALYYWLVQASYSMIYEIFVPTKECCIFGYMSYYFVNSFFF